MTSAAGAVDVDAYAEGVLAGDRAHVARAITLVESTRADHREAAQELLVRLLPHAGESRRVGISGVPGAGKSTFIDELGTQLTAADHRVAVLAVDPSSTRRGGSILGDKTRMARLSVDPNAYIRPSPSSGSLGGVTRSTREAIVVVEAAGFDVVIVETVGVGQSEVAVAGMVDCFVLLMVARTGDSLQGIKRGVLELAEVLAVNKADGDRVTEAKAAARELADALRLLGSPDPEWEPPVLTCSALTGDGIDRVWHEIERHHDLLASSGRLAERRRTQAREWSWAMATDRVLDRFRHHPAVTEAVPRLYAALDEGKITAAQAADALLAAFDEGTPPSE